MNLTRNLALELPALKQAHGRIVTTSSSGHNFAPGPTGLVIDSFTGGPARDEVIKKWGNLTASPRLYGQSKLVRLTLTCSR